MPACFLLLLLFVVFYCLFVFFEQKKQKQNKQRKLKAHQKEGELWLQFHKKIAGYCLVSLLSVWV